MTRHDYLDRYDAVCRAEEALDSATMRLSPKQTALFNAAYSALGALRREFWDKSQRPECWE